MAELHAGERVELSGGGYLIVEKELGRGGQGIVYLVDIGGEKKALKWYTATNILSNADFYKNLNGNIQHGAPRSGAFLWPEKLTQKKEGAYGYVMALRQPGYQEFGEFLLAKTRFKTIDGMLAAAMRICDGFKKLHDIGYSYQDLNDGNFFINPDDGDVLICDNDNVVPSGTTSGIMGKVRYMAPEVVASKKPDIHSDKFSLSVILFMLFFGNHPFEGASVLSCPCMTETYEKKFFGSDAVFIYDDVNTANRPVKGFHTNVLNRWPLFPDILKNAFKTEFSRQKLTNPQQRMVEDEWQRIIAAARDALVICPHCGKETFVSSDKPSSCLACQKNIDTSQQLTLGKRILVLTNKTQLFIDHDNIPDAIVTKDSDSRLWLKNISGDTWKVTTPSGKKKDLPTNEMLPVRSGIKIRFKLTHSGEIK